jgi:beta-lactamase regulating signal transducer with metallopeptidase domain
MSDYLTFTSILVTYGLSVVASWILAGIFRVSLRELSGAGWANFFLLGSQILNQLLFMGDFGSDLFMPANMFTLAILFLVSLAVTRNLRGLARSLSEHYKWLMVFVGFSYLVAICLLAYPVILVLAITNSYTYSPDLYQYINKIMPYTGTLSLGGYSACVAMLFVTALIGIRVIEKIQHEVRVAKEDQRQQIERLRNQIDLMNRELSNLL